MPADFSNVSDNALNYTGNLIRTDKSIKVTVLHSTKSEVNNRDREALEAKLQEICDQYSASIPNCNYLIKPGDLNSAILSVQAEFDYDLIIMGTAGSVMEESEAATNTSKLVMEADCPVLVIPQETRDFKIRNMALALSDKEIDDSQSLGVLFDIARSFDAKVHVLTIQKEEGKETAVTEENENVVEYYLEALDHHYTFPQNADIEKGIAEYVDTHEIDILAIMPRNHAKKSKPSEGRLTKLLTLHTQVPLLTID